MFLLNVCILLHFRSLDKTLSSNEDESDIESVKIEVEDYATDHSESEIDDTTVELPRTYKDDERK